MHCCMISIRGGQHEYCLIKSIASFEKVMLFCILHLGGAKIPKEFTGDWQGRE